MDSPVEGSPYFDYVRNEKSLETCGHDRRCTAFSLCGGLHLVVASWFQCPCHFLCAGEQLQIQRFLRRDVG